MIFVLLFIAFTCVFLFTIFTSVNLILLICQNKHLIQSLLDGSNAARILAFDHVHNLLRQLQLFLCNDLFVLDDIYGNIMIDKTKDIQIQIFNRAFYFDDIFNAHFITFGIFDNRNGAVQLIKLQVMIDGHGFARFDVVEYVDEMEREKYPDEPQEAPKAAPEADGRIKVLAVTACPTGIAHTYMAAEALEKAGKKLGISIKVETNGSGGAKNILTKEEIEQCDGIIVAADKNVEMARFDGKKVWKTKVSDGIKIPEELIQKIESGDVPVYHHAGGAGESQDSGDNESFGRKMYKHLMNGVSNMLPFTIAGGIFIAIAFLIDTLAGAPQDSSFGTYTAAAAFFKTIGGYAFNFMVPILAAYIGKSIADRPGFLVGLVGGYLATTGSTFAAISGDVPSGFLGALLAGFAGGFLMLGVEKLCDHMPKALNGIKPVLIYPLVGLGMIAILMCAVNPFMGMINTGLSDLLNSMGSSSKILLGCVLGGMMSIDMGGPFNKAAYVFGTMAIASGRPWLPAIRSTFRRQ